MKQQFHPAFDTMDALSMQGDPFFFMVDFRMEEVEVFPLHELEIVPLWISFPGLNSGYRPEKIQKPLLLSARPVSEEVYKKGFDMVQKHLKLGNSYLANYTTQTQIDINYSLEEIFLASSAKYKVLYRDRFVFFSPETFVEVKDQHIYTHPMKGTIDAAVPDAEQVLKNDIKEKAEHYTVVDLLRNDLSMVADDVRLTEFQRIDFIKTRQKNLLAMSSEISGALKPEFQGKVGSLMKTLLPAGSILGAPKPKTMEIILEAEGYHRGFYTGVCGYFDGHNLDSCVMIRFIEKQNDQLFFKSGGGITHLSKLADEYQEMKNKIYVPVH